MTRRKVLAGTCAALALFGLGQPTYAQHRAIDSAHSTIKVGVSKSGLFSAFGHNHEIAAPIAEGWVELSPNPSVSLRIEARQLKVLDPDMAAEERAKVQKTMEGPEVLDVAKYSEIRFDSTSAERTGSGRWRVQGKLILHGTTRSVTLLVEQAQDTYRGSVLIRQRDFGIQPVKVAGGTVRVKDEVKIEFLIVLVPR